MKKSVILTLLLGVAAAAACQGSSVLASGSWWRLTVRISGVYRLTTATIPQLDGTPVATIGLYGSGGKQLSLSNNLAPTADLQPIAVDIVDRNGNGRFDASDEVLFYGEGPDTWHYDAGDDRWEMARHAYSSANFYYLTTEAPSPMRIRSVALPPSSTTLTTYTAVAAVNNDLTNLFRSGQTWLGERFTTSVSQRTFTLAFPATATGIKLRYALAHKGSATASFTVGAAGLTATHPISPLTIYGTWLEATASPAQTLPVTITYSPTETTGEGYLDYIEATGRVALNFTGTQTAVRNDRIAESGFATYHLGTSAADLRVWNTTRHNAVYELPVADDGWTDSCAAPATYCLFAPGSLPEPAGVEPVANQDLHGAGPADYIVVCHPQLRAQADRLAALHAVLDNLTTLVVTDAQIYNEFSSGKQDPMAIRAFLRHLKAQHPARPPHYLLLLGKATYDPRNLLGNDLPTVATYETAFSFDDDGASYASDDMLGYLDPDETGGSTQTLDVAVGRLPAKSVAEARHMIDKIEGYMTRRDLQADAARGDWRNYVALLADDADPGRPADTSFVHSSEATASLILDSFPSLNIDRLYADAYTQQSGAIGSFYPELKNALRHRMDYGCLLINYIGHGSTHYIGTERYIEPADVAAYTNIDRLPLFVTSTCSYGYHDLPDEVSGAEACLLAQGGAIAVVSASRPISHIERFNTDVILYALHPDHSIGDALRMAKNRTPVSPCIGLTGDPALRLARPTHEVLVTQVNSRDISSTSTDTADALSTVTIAGEVRRPDGTLADDFNGTLYPIVFDRATETSTLANDNPGTEVRFAQQKSILYKGSTPVAGGRYEYTFTVPLDIPYQYAPCKLSHYAVSGSDDAGGAYQRLHLGGLDEEAVVYELRPTIRLFLGDTNFRDGGLTDGSPTLLAQLADSVGINAFGSGLGHDITLTLDNQAGSLTVLNDFFQPDIDNPRCGAIAYPLAGLVPGPHTLTLKAWNIWGYSQTASLRFHVSSADTTRFSALTAWPNPATTHTLLRYETNNAAAITAAVLHFYSPQGALIESLTPAVAPDSYVVGPVRLDTSQLPPGAYLVQIIVSTDDGKNHQAAIKVILR